MKSKRVFLLTVLSAICGISVEGRKGFGPGEQEYGYVDVRPGAHMFYWLYYTTAGVDFTSKPLVMWLQGGPGGSSTSFGNFEEIGPLKVDLKPRNSTWAKYVNLLFVDNPVGTGFSYVDKNSLLPSKNKEVGKDLVELMRGFLEAHPKFKIVPFYVFCESYGGKMTAEFALQLHQEIKAQKIEVNFKGVGLGDSWISPIDSVLTWAPYLYTTGLLDENGYKEVDKWAQRTAQAVKSGNFYQATTLWSKTEQVIQSRAGYVDFYNILTPVSAGGIARSALDRNATTRIEVGELNKLMNGPVRQALGETIPAKVVHEAQSSAVFNALYKDFMVPVTNVVEELLNTTSLEVVVYTGQLDLIVDTLGTVKWVNALKWSEADYWKTRAPRENLMVNGIVEGFVKTAKKLSFYWINRAGHMVPLDNPAATIEMLRRITKFDKKNIIKQRTAHAIP